MSVMEGASPIRSHSRLGEQNGADITIVHSCFRRPSAWATRLPCASPCFPDLFSCPRCQLLSRSKSPFCQTEHDVTLDTSRGLSECSALFNEAALKINNLIAAV